MSDSLSGHGKRKAPSAGPDASAPSPVMKKKRSDSVARPTKAMGKPKTAPPPRPFLVLRISTSSLSEVFDVEAAIGVSQLSAGANVHLEVLAGEVDQLNIFASACGESSWLQVVAHNIFDPVEQRGRLWTHSQGTIEDWRTSPRNEVEWHCVSSKTPLKSAVYEYVMPPNITVTVPRMCRPQESSVISPEELDASEEFLTALIRRDQDRCIVSHCAADNIRLIAAHIVPRHLEHFVKAIAERCARTAQAPIDNIWDPRIGVILNGSLDSLFDCFDAGLFCDAVSGISRPLRSVS
jgi:hypothetical protein